LRGTRFVKVFLAAAAAAVCVRGAHAESTSAEPVPRIWLNAGLYSWHFDRSENLRNDNVGLGIEVALTSEHALMAGSIINSNRARTRYAGYAWRPLYWSLAGTDVAAGVAIGAFDGYPNYKGGGWFAAPLPLVSVEGRRLGVNLSLIPTLKNRVDGALAIQLKLRVY
jgi:hypothetical protein